MNVVEFSFRLSSLFSMRIPYTYQSALTYPIPPPSVLKGMAANALQRWERTDPVNTFRKVEQDIPYAFGVALGPVVVRSYILRLLKLEGNKPIETDALPRQFGWSVGYRAYFLAKEENLATDLAKALRHTPLSLGDGESLLYPEYSRLWSNPRQEKVPAGSQVETEAYVAKDLVDVRSANSRPQLFWVHERSLESRELIPYLFPLKYKDGLYEPETILGVTRKDVLRTMVGEVQLITGVG